MSKLLENQIYIGSEGKKSQFDLAIPENFSGQCVVFTHGFMGFKNWGVWHLVQNYFVQNGFAFCKFNLSHNGTSIEKNDHFVDLEAFGKNTYSIEIQDLKCLLKHLSSTFTEIQNFHLIGHSRGGATTILTYSDLIETNNPLISKIKSLVLWASICDIASRFPSDQELEEWKNSGVRYVSNSRTNQQLPQFYSLFEDFENNREKLNIEKCSKSISIPVFIAHGDKDSSVLMEEGLHLSSWFKQQLNVIKNADHVFGAKHPWVDSKPPKHLKELLGLTFNFLQRFKKDA